MPNRDKTGPEGKGPRTGRGLGSSSDEKTEKITNESIEDGELENRRGRGRCRGRGRGRGRGDCFNNRNQKTQKLKKEKENVF